MENFTKNKIVQKIVIILVTLIIFNFCMPPESHAGTSFFGKLGGNLIEPVFDLLMFVGDSLLEVVQSSLLTGDKMMYNGETEEEEEVKWGWLVVGVIALTIATVATAGVVGGVVAAGGVLAGIGAIASTTTAVAVGSALVCGYAGSQFLDGLSGSFELPDIQYTPYAIFSGAIPALDINFIGASEDDNGTWMEYTETYQTEGADWRDETKVSDWDARIIYTIEAFKANNWYNGQSTDEDIANLNNYSCGGYEEVAEYINGKYKEEYHEARVNGNSWNGTLNPVVHIENSYGQQEEFELLTQLDRTLSQLYDSNADDEFIRKFKEVYETISPGEEERVFCEEGIELESVGRKVTVQEWFLCRLLCTYTGSSPDVGEVKEYKSSAYVLKDVIANGYKSLTLLALALLLVILVYVGIRILISSTSADKSKYKKMFFDWFIALALLFVLHVIMLLIITVSQDLTKIFATDTADAVVMPLPEDVKVDGISLKEKYPERLYEGKPVWITSYMGYIRAAAGIQSVTRTESGSQGYQVGYIIVYLVLVIYTLVFTFIYVKRVIYIAFLTLIAPLVAITYPLDKIKDGQAQAFNMWIREYIFNALLQPIHMLIYLLLINSVLKLALNYPVYAIVAIGFMIPAEKFIRSMFGFEKAQTVGAFGGAAAAGLVMSGVNRIASFGRGKDKDNKGTDKDKDNKVYYRDAMGGMDAMMASMPGTLTTSTLGGSTPTPGGSTPTPGGSTPTPGGPTPTPGGPTPTPGGPTPTPSRPIPTPGGPTPVPNGPTPTPQGRLKRIAGKSIRGIVAAGRATYKKGPGVKRKIVKGFARGIGAVGMGTLGLAAGVATGDLGKTAQFTGAGALAGYTLGGAGAATLMNKGSEAAEGFKQGYYGDSYQDIVNAKALKAFKADGKNINTFTRNLSDSERKNLDIDKYFSQNIGSAEDMVVAEKMRQKYLTEGMSADAAFNAAVGSMKLSKQIGTDPRTNPEAEAKWLKNFEEKTGSSAVAQEMLRRVKNAFDAKENVK